jgi:hypothetical protein
MSKQSTMLPEAPDVPTDPFPDVPREQWPQFELASPRLAAMEEHLQKITAEEERLRLLACEALKQPANVSERPRAVQGNPLTFDNQQKIAAMPKEPPAAKLDFDAISAKRDRLRDAMHQQLFDIEAERRALSRAHLPQLRPIFHRLHQRALAFQESAARAADALSAFRADYEAQGVDVSSFVPAGLPAGK